jgi:DNA-binding transcriptional LysR family regulator
MNSVLLADMMLFLAVVEQKSFTAAAKQFGITKSVVSKRITRLEKALGVQLLFRSTRKLSLSDVGETLFQRCQKIKEDLHEVEQVIKATHAEPQGRLRVATPASFARLHLVSAVADFMRQYSQVEVEILHGGAYEDLVEHGTDCAIRIGHLPDSSLLAKRLTVRKMRVCAAPAYLEKHGVPKTPDDLVQHNCLTHKNSPTGNEWHFLCGRKQQRVQVTGNFSAGSSQVLEKAAVDGIGIVMLPGYMMTKDIQSGNLQRLLEDYCQDEIGIYAVFNQSKHIAPKLRAFIDFLYQRFADEGYWS